MFLKPAFPVLNRSHPWADVLLGAWLCSEGSGATVRDHARHNDATGEMTGNWQTGPTGYTRDVSQTPMLTQRAVPWGSQVTIACRVRPWEVRSDQAVLGKHGGDLLAIEQSSVRYWSGGTTNDYVTVTGLAYLPGQWIDLVLVVDGVSHTYYIASQAPVVRTANTASSGLSQAIWIGAWRSPTDRPFSGDIDYIQIYSKAWDEAAVRQFQLDPYAAFREPRSKFTWLFVSPPENLTAPTLHINPDGTWTGGLGTWSGSPTNYDWELRRASDDSVADSGSTSDAEAVLVGSGLGVGNYYLWVLASNSGGSGVAESVVGRYAARMRVEAVGSYTPIAVKSAYVGGAIAKQGSAV